MPREVWNSFYGPSSTFLSSFALEFQVYSPGTMEQTVHLLQSIEPCPHISRILHHLKIQLLLPDDVADALSQISDLSWESFALGVSRHTSIKTVKVVIGDWFGDRVEPRLEEIASIRQALSSLDERAVLEVYEEKIEFEMIQSLHP